MFRMIPGQSSTLTVTHNVVKTLQTRYLSSVTSTPVLFFGQGLVPSITEEVTLTEVPSGL